MHGSVQRNAPTMAVQEEQSIWSNPWTHSGNSGVGRRRPHHKLNAEANFNARAVLTLFYYHYVRLDPAGPSIDGPCARRRKDPSITHSLPSAVKAP